MEYGVPMLQSGNMSSHTEVERCKLSQEQRITKFQCYRHRMFQHPLAHQTGVPATHRSKGKNKFPIPTEYCHQPATEAQNTKFLYLHVTGLDVFRELSPTA
jgi:hypothetical protein